MSDGTSTGVEVGGHLLDAIVRLVRAKYEVDKRILDRETAKERLMRGDFGGPERPWEYFRSRFPFVEQLWLNEEPSVEMEVPTSQTLGCSWSWRAADVDASRRQELILKLQKQAKNTDNIHYLWVRQLGLFIPLEGKNRVDFFRELGVATIPALVTPCNYPEPHRFRVYQTDLAGIPRAWVVLDENYALDSVF